MAKTKTKDILNDYRTWTPKQLSGKIAEAHQKLVKFNQDKVLGKLKNTSEIKEVRKSIARMNTILDEKVTEELKNA